MLNCRNFQSTIHRIYIYVQRLCKYSKRLSVVSVFISIGEAKIEKINDRFWINLNVICIYCKIQSTQPQNRKRRFNIIVENKSHYLKCHTESRYSVGFCYYTFKFVQQFGWYFCTRERLKRTFHFLDVVFVCVSFSSFKHVLIYKAFIQSRLASQMPIK